MRKPGVFQHGTAKQHGEDAAKGYCSSGTSEHSRNAAHSGNIKLASYTVSPGKLRGPRSLNELIKEHHGKMTKLLLSLSAERDPERRERLMKSLAIKREFIAKLERERAGLWG